MIPASIRKELVAASNIDKGIERGASDARTKAIDNITAKAKAYYPQCFFTEKLQLTKV